MNGVDLRPLRPDDAAALGRFLEAMTPDEQFFHPHPLTREAAGRLCAESEETRDEYVVAERDGEIVAYGMLRGWDEGYEIPSLGIAVHPGARGIGVGKAMMLHLHGVAARRNAPSVRLKVSVDNTTAVDLYRSLGYVFEPLGNDELLGQLSLSVL
jgi:ribosomal protein S18 acetylase RimI-like enzyme